ncbi:MAG: InlB B-repeat-containing protein, partial [Gaiellaceae bacterium]
MPSRLSVAGVLVFALLLVSGASGLASAPGAQRVTASSGPVVGTISLPGKLPSGLAVDESRNKLFVADDANGDLLTIDGTSRQVVASVAVGRGVASDAMFVDEAAGKVYVASGYAFGEGSGLISVVDANTGALLKTIDPVDGYGTPGHADWYRVAGDGTHGKVYVSFFCPGCDTNLGVIDVATDTFTSVLKNVAPTFVAGFGVQGVNTVTNEAFAVNATTLYVIDGATLNSSSSALPYLQPLSFAVNEVQNKLYFWFNAGPPLQVLNRATNQYKVLEDSGDTEPLVFNQTSDTLFSGAQVAQDGVIVDGDTDAVTDIEFGEGGMGAGAVRSSTDNAYFVTTEKTFVVNGALKQFQIIPTGHSTGGGLFYYSVVVDQQRGLVYAVNDYNDGVISVIQDGPPKTLAVATAGPGSGTVTSNPAGISCGSTCSHVFAYRTDVTLTATPSPGSSFTGWSGDCSGTGTCTLALAANHSATATFALAPKTLTVSKYGTGTGTVTSSPAGIDCGATCSRTYTHGTVVTLTAIPSPGSSFLQWLGDCPDLEGPCTVTMSSNQTVIATFVPATHTLTVARAGGGSGSVAGTAISCPGACSARYASGTLVTLIATPASGSVFGGWSGGGCRGTGSCAVTISSDQTVTATFTPVPSITAFRLTHTRFRVGPHATALTARASAAARRPKVPQGSKFLYTLSRASTATIVIERQTSGHVIGKKCVA